MSGKKPVWVEEEAYACLKAWKKLQDTRTGRRATLLAIASDLVISKLPLLEGGAVAEPAREAAPSAPAPAQEVTPAAPPVTVALTPAPARAAVVNTDAPAEEKKPQRQLIDRDLPGDELKPIDRNEDRFYGGVFLLQ